MYKFITANKEFFKEKFNRVNMLLIYKRIFLSFDLRFFKGLIKSLFM